MRPQNFEVNSFLRKIQKWNIETKKKWLDLLKHALLFIAKLDDAFLNESIVKEYRNIHTFITAAIAFLFSILFHILYQQYEMKNTGAPLKRYKRYWFKWSHDPHLLVLLHWLFWVTWWPFVSMSLVFLLSLQGAAFHTFHLIIPHPITSHLAYKKRQKDHLSSR